MSWRTEGLSITTLTIIDLCRESVESYSKAGKEVRVARPKRCPACGCKNIIFWGKRARWAIDDTHAWRIYAQRVKCKGCSKTHTILPDFLFCRRSHLAVIIFLALTLVFKDRHGIKAAAFRLNISRSTTFRWVKNFKANSDLLYQRLSSLYRTAYPHAPPPAPTTDLCAAVLDLSKGLFTARHNRAPRGEDVSRWLSQFTCGYLLALPTKGGHCAADRLFASLFLGS